MYTTRKYPSWQAKIVQISLPSGGLYYLACTRAKTLATLLLGRSAERNRA